jgi:hypothetical protein
VHLSPLFALYGRDEKGSRGRIETEEEGWAASREGG